MIGATWEKVNVLSRAVGNNCHSPKNNPDMNKNMLYKLMNLLYVRRIFPVLLFSIDKRFYMVSQTKHTTILLTMMHKNI